MLRLIALLGPILAIIWWAGFLITLPYRSFSYLDKSFKEMMGLDIFTLFEVYSYLMILVAFLALYFAINISWKNSWSEFFKRLLAFSIVGQLYFLFTLLTVLILLYIGHWGFDSAHYIANEYGSRNFGNAAWVSFYSLLLFGLMYGGCYITAYGMAECDNELKRQSYCNQSFIYFFEDSGYRRSWLGAAFSVLFILLCSIVIEHHFGEFIHTLYPTLSGTRLILLISLFFAVALFVVAIFVNTFKNQIYSKRTTFFPLIGTQMLVGILLCGIFTFLSIEMLSVLWRLLVITVNYGSYFSMILPLIFTLIMLCVVAWLAFFSLADSYCCFKSLKDY